MPSTYQSKSAAASKERLFAAEQERRDNLTILVRAYDAVRRTRGPQRDEAESALGEALKKHKRPFRCEGHVWQWSPCQQSILRHKATGMHPRSSHGS